MATNLPWNEKLNVFQIDPCQATLDDISKMATALSELQDDKSVNDFDNWEVHGSNSGCTGIVLNCPNPGDESVCFRNVITNDIKYKILGK